MNEYKSNIWKMYFFNFLTSLSFFGALIVPFFTTWGHLNFTQILFLQSWFSIWIFILEVPTGTIADYFGRKYSVALGAFVVGIGAIIYSITPNFYLFLFGEFLWALGAALMSGADDAFIYDSLKKNKEEKKSKKIISRYETFALIGALVAALVSGFIATFFGIQYTMMFTAIPMFLGFIVAFTLKEPKIKIKKESKRYWKIFKTGVKYLYGHKPLWFLILDSVVIGILFYYIIWAYQPLLQNAGVSVAFFGIIQALFFCSEIFFVNIYSKLEALVKSKRLLFFIIPLLVSVFYIAIAFFRSVWLILLFVFVAGGLAYAKRTILRSYMNKHIKDSSTRATVLSSVSMINRFSLAILSPFVGMLMDWSLTYTLVSIGIFGLVFTIFSKVKEEHLID